VVLNLAYGIGEEAARPGFDLIGRYWQEVGIGVKLRRVKWAMIAQNRLDGALLAPYPVLCRPNLINVPDTIAPTGGVSLDIDLYGDQFFFRVH
jgi:hypothetical protein